VSANRVRAQEAEHLADKIVVIDKGKVIAEGTADQLKAQTGGSTLDARVADPTDLGRAVAVLVALGKGEPRSDPDQRRLSIPAGEGTDLLLEVGRRFQEAEIALDDLGIRRPTLDEVFLALTGGTESPDNAGTARGREIQ